MLFDPGKSAAARRAEKAAQVAAEREIRRWVTEMLPDFVRHAPKDHPGACVISVREVACNDPNCAPIDTSVTLLFNNGQAGAMSFPQRMVEVTRANVESSFPAESSIIAWHEGREDISAAAARAVDDVENELEDELALLDPVDQRALLEHLIEHVKASEQATMDRMLQEEEQLQQQRRRALQQDDKQSVRLLSAAQQNDAEQVRALVESGISATFANTVGQTALHIAALWGSAEACAALLRHGADLNAQNALSGATPLHMAASSNKDLGRRVECARLIVEAGADLTIVDYENKTASQQAARVPGQDALAHLLRPP